MRWANRRRLLLALVAAAALTLAGAAAALASAGALTPNVSDVTGHDSIVRVTLRGAIKEGGDAWVDTRTPEIDIQVLQPGWTVQCRLGEFGNDVPCGTQQTSGCPASACWTYTPTLHDGFVDLFVDYEGTDVPSYLEFQFFVDSTAPGTVLHTPPNGPPSRPRFHILPKDERYLNSSLADYDKVQCVLSLASNSGGRWGGCGKLPKLHRKATYRLRARTVDPFGRIDPNPPQYVFSPTPCGVRLAGHPSPRAALQHGVRARVHCVQPSHFDLNVGFPLSVIEHYYHGRSPGTLGPVVRGKTTRQGQSETIKVPTYRLKPADIRTILGTARRKPGYRVELSLYQRAWGAPAFVRDLLR